MRDKTHRNASPLEGMGAPPQVVGALLTLRDDLVQGAREGLSALVVYGSLARGRYRPGKSDVNLAIVLRAISCEALSAIARPLRTAWESIRVDPLLLILTELSRVAEVFPLKISEIQER